MSEEIKALLHKGYVELSPCITEDEFGGVVETTLRDEFSRTLADTDETRSFLEGLYKQVVDGAEEDESLIITMDIFEAIAEEHGVFMS